MTIEDLKQNPNLILLTIYNYALNNQEVDEETRKLLISNKDLIKEINPEELYKIFKEFMITDNPSKYIREFKEIFFLIIPGLQRTYKFEQHNKWHIYDVFEHTMHVIDNTGNNPSLRIAALFHDLGKPLTYTEEKIEHEDGHLEVIGHFYRHPLYSRSIFNKFAKYCNIPKEEKELISKLVAYHDFTLSTKPIKMDSYIEDLGKENIPLLFALKRADNLAQNPELTGPCLTEIDSLEVEFNEYMKRGLNNG